MKKEMSDVRTERPGAQIHLRLARQLRFRPAVRATHAQSAPEERGRERRERERVRERGVGQGEAPNACKIIDASR